MSGYKEKIMSLVDSIRPDIQTLAMFAFQGIGDIDELRGCFIKTYEAAAEGERLFKETFPGRDLEAPVTLCGDEMELAPVAEFYEHLKSEDFCPTPFDAEKYCEYTMTLNHIFIALQQAE